MPQKPAVSPFTSFHPELSSMYPELSDNRKVLSEHYPEFSSFHLELSSMYPELFSFQ